MRKRIDVFFCTLGGHKVVTKVYVKKYYTSSKARPRYKIIVEEKCRCGKRSTRIVFATGLSRVDMINQGWFVE